MFITIPNQPPAIVAYIITSGQTPRVPKGASVILGEAPPEQSVEIPKKAPEQSQQTPEENLDSQDKSLPPTDQLQLGSLTDS